MFMVFRHLLILVLVIISCKSEENIVFEFDPRVISENKIYLSEIADDIVYIALGNSIPIGIYYHIELVNNLIYISIKDVGVVIFNRDGTILNKVGNIGRGPGEYRFFMNFSVDEQNGNVYVLDYDIIKIYSGNGNYLRDIPLKETGGHFQEVKYFDSKLFIPEYIGIGKAKFNWIIIDTLGRMVSQKKNFIPEFSSTFLFKGGTYKYENRIQYWDIYNDTVFSIFPDLHYETSFLFSQGSHRHPRSLVADYSTLSNVFHPHAIFETNHFFVLGYYFQKNALALIDKESKKASVNYFDQESGGISNDLDAGAPFKPTGNLIEKDREYLAGLIQAFQLKAIVQSNEFKISTPKYPQKKKDLEKLASRMKETDNPVLMLVRLKK